MCFFFCICAERGVGKELFRSSHSGMGSGWWLPKNFACLFCVCLVIVIFCLLLLLDFYSSIFFDASTKQRAKNSSLSKRRMEKGEYKSRECGGRRGGGRREKMRRGTRD